MLPILICEASEAVRALLIEAIAALSTSVQLRVVAVSESCDSIERYLQRENGITMTVLGLSLYPNNREQGLSLGRRIMKQNRDNFTVYLIHEHEGLQDLLMACGRPAGILLSPFTRESIAACLQRVVNEFQALDDSDDAEQMLTVTCASTTHRIPYREITFIEALDKKLTIYTPRQAITLRGTLGQLTDSLPESFIRCHRSYIVNVNYVSKYDSADSTLTLSSGDIVPISRSSKAAVRERLAGNGAET